ncbi:SAM-dependent methyltransferase [Dactylosporangium sp. McL0621]|uniref:SAM-dependent methyltransferase n=1 Tax=Dactylosporangium sp. McL0621 TaxID=3415678 RepID=UPI003CEE6DCE
MVRFAVESGVRQFLDLGSGIPTEGNVHEIAQALDPASRVVYVDLEPTAVLHAREILAGVPRTAAVQGDLQHPDGIFADPAVTGLLDLDAPVCLLMIAVLHFVPSGPPMPAALRRYRETFAPGSCLAISHATGGARPEELGRVADLYSRTGTPLVVRDRDEVAALFDGWRLVAPGIVYGPLWRPEPDQPPAADPAPRTSPWRASASSPDPRPGAGEPAGGRTPQRSPAVTRRVGAQLTYTSGLPATEVSATGP